MRRLLVASTALVLVLPAQVATATTTAAATKPARNLAAYQNRGPITLDWTNPAGTDRVLGRFARGRTAPASTGQGHPLDLARLAHATTLKGLKPGTAYSVAVWTKHAGVLSKPTTISFFTKPAENTAPEPRGTISGIVTDASGDPLDNAAISAYGRHDFSKTVSDARGRFVLRTPADRYFVIADGARATGGDSDATGYQGDLQTVQLASGGSRSVSLVLPDGGAVRGVVTDAGGHPLKGIAVTYQPPQPYLTPSFGFGSVTFAGIDVTRTNSSGRYTLKGLGRAGVVPCFDPRAGYVARCATRATAVAARQTVTVPVVALTAHRGGTISGKVTAASGQRLRDVFVDAIRVGGNADAFVDSRSGRFTLAGLAPGRWRVCAVGATRSALGLLPSCVVRTVAANRTTHASLLLRTAGAISGRVLGPTGRAVRNPAVSISRVHSHGGGIQAETGSVALGGFFTIGGLSAGQYRVCVGGSGSSATPGDPTGVARRCFAHPVHVVAGRDRIGIDRSLPPGGAATGRVTDTAGHPIAGADASLEPLGPGFAFNDAFTGRDGRYDITDLTPGRYRLCVFVSSNTIYGSDQQHCLRRAITIAASHTTTGLDVQFAAQPILRVTVTDSSGHPLSGVEVAALRACSDRYFCPPQPVFGPRKVAVDTVNMTDARGKATLHTTRSGHFAVCALGYYGATPTGTSPTGYADKCTGSTFDVTTSVGSPASASIALDDGAAVTGRVTNAQGHGVHGAQIHITGGPIDDIASPFGFEESDPGIPTPFTDSVSDARGRYTIHSIRPGQAQVCARNAKGYQDGCLSNALALTGGSSTTAPNLVLTPKTGNAPAAVVHATARRPAWRETVVGGRVIDRGATSARPTKYASPFGRALTTQLALAGDLRRFGS